MKKQVVKIKPTVEKLLRENPALRDDDYKLIAVIWRDLLPTPYQYAKDFFVDFAHGKYPHPESIRRSRAKLQKDNPELRGKLYGKRKGQAEAEMREEMTQDWKIKDDHQEDRLPPTSLETTKSLKSQP